MAYRSPFITETDEPAFTDCQFASGLMLVAEWTDGEAIHDEHGNTRDTRGLKALRERIRVLSGDTEGGASLEDLARGVARRFPDLPPLPRTTALTDPLRLDFIDLWARLQAGYCAVLNGNRSRIMDPASPLCSMQGNDDYDHAVFLHIARLDKAFVMDPLGRGGYQGRWVAKDDLSQFASRFVTPSGSPYCSVVKRGQQSSAERLRRQVGEETKALRAEVASARSAATAARELALTQARDAIDVLRRVA